METDASISEIALGSLRRRRGECAVIAHRGFSSAYPDNTIEAFERAIAAGADLVEIDLRLSCDGVLVCHHDAALGDTDVAVLTADALAGRQVAMLSEALPVLKGRIGIVFDLKRADTALADAAISVLDRFSMQRQVVVGVRAIEQARRVRAASADVVILGLLTPRDSFSRFYDAGGDIARLWEDECTVDRLAAARCGDRPVWVTAGRRAMNDAPGDIDADRLARLFGKGIDGVLVNDPALACRVRPASAPRPHSVSP